jgi:hypothetical protein
MEPVLIHHGEDRRHLGDLMADRLGIITGEGVAAEAALGRLAVDDLADLFGRNKGAGLAVMARLSASLLARGRSRRPSLDRGRIGRRRLGGIGGILAEAFFEVGDSPLKGLHEPGDGRLCLGRKCLPESL